MPDQHGDPPRRRPDRRDAETSGLRDDAPPGADTEVIGLFPLGTVLLPGAALPVHIFERRYRDMIEDLPEVGAGRSFGVVSLVRGTETSRDVEVAQVGTLAEIVEQQSHTDGTHDLLTIGSRRFRILSVDRSSRSYLQARIVWLPEEEGSLPAALLLGARSLCQRYCDALAAVSGRPAGDPPARDPLKLSYEIAQRLHLHAGERQALLAAPDIATRLRLGSTLLRREITVLHRTRTVPVSTRALMITPRPN